MGADLAGAFATARDVFQEVDEALKQNLFKLMREGPESELVLTENAQPALMAVSIAIVRILEKDDGERRNPEKYYFSIFGDPSENGTWSYRVEGHHISLHFIVVNGKGVATPMFYGTNPAEVKEGVKNYFKTIQDKPEEKPVPVPVKPEAPKEEKPASTKKAVG